MHFPECFLHQTIKKQNESQTEQQLKIHFESKEDQVQIGLC